MNLGSNIRFGILLRNARKRVGMTQRQLAELSTISVRAIRDLELDCTKAPRAQTISLLADALRLSKARRAELEAAAGLASGHSLIEDLVAPPALLGPIVGREHETASLTDLLESSGHRLLKVVGMPGIGKSRLIQKVANDLHQSGRMSVIHLARESAAQGGKGVTPSGLIDRIADRIGCEPTADDVTAALTTNEVLLTVDGRDLDEDGELELRLLLHRCPGLRVLYETCETSSTSDTCAFSVFPLAVPEWRQGRPTGADFAAYPTVQLMLSRCGQLYPQAVSDPDVLAALAGICWLLDGIPSALESAASWLLVHEPVQLLDAAARSPLMLLTSPVVADDALTSWLRRTVASLAPDDAVGLRRLAGVDPWTAEEAIRLLHRSPAEALRVIHLLRACGLVRRVNSGNGERPRFMVLNLVHHLLDAEGAAARGPVQCAAAGSVHRTEADPVL
ncbi:helix-turn-helix domain-containing protein [Streptomyces sp. NPDC020330]|uniref:helix-turn-helix domain-containing protein n=1 Tax=unclassified Streptomyces TaxID=2593676 RepID=UPI00378889BD